MDFQTRVSATQTFYRHLHGSIVGIRLHLFIIKGGSHVDTASATYHELAPVLRVEVHEDIAVEFIGRQPIGAKHARLFVSGNQGLNRSVLQGLILHDGHNGSHAQTIICAKRSALGLYPLTVDPRLDGIGLEIMGTFRCLLRNHIHVSLQDDAFLLLHSR